MKTRTAKEQLHNACKMLTEYSRFDMQKKLETFPTHLVPAITKVYNAVVDTEPAAYSRMDELSYDFLLADIHLIRYHSEKGEHSYIKYEKAKELQPPKGSYKVLDNKLGKYQRENGMEFTSIRIAVDYALDTLANKWIQEIPVIQKSCF